MLLVAARWIAMALLKTANWASLAITITTLIDQALKYLETTYKIPLATAKNLLVSQLFTEADKLGLSRRDLLNKLPARVRTTLGLTLDSTTKPSVDKSTLSKVVNEEAAGLNLKGAAKVGFYKKLLKNPAAIAISLLAITQLDVFAWGPKMIAEGLSKWGFGDWFLERQYKEIGTEWTDAQMDDLTKAYHAEGANQMIIPEETGLQDLTPTNLKKLEEILRRNAATRGEVWERQDFIKEAAKWIRKDGKPFKPELLTPTGRAAWSDPATQRATYKVVSGIVSQGVLGATVEFQPRTIDLIDSVEELRVAAENNLVPYIAALPGKVIYELKLISSVVDKDGFRHTGEVQEIVTGERKDGTEIIKKVTNRWAVLDIYIFTSRRVRSKIEQIILGPVDSVKVAPTRNELLNIENSLKSDIFTNDVSIIEKVEGQVEIGAKIPTKEETKYINVRMMVTGIGRVADVDTWNQIPDGAFVELAHLTGLEGYRNLFIKGGRTLFETKTADIAGKTVYNIEFGPQDIIRFAAILPDGAAQIVSERNPYATAEQARARLLQTIPPSMPTFPPPPEALAKKCASKTLYEWFVSTGEPFPSISERAPLYEGMGLGPAAYYVGTAEQNTKMLSELKRRNKCL